MTVSMTGYAARQGANATHSWSWDLRAVNGRGLDLRLRVPDWIEGLEQGIRARLQKSINRGSVQMNLRVMAAPGAGATALDPAGLDAALAMVAETERRAAAGGVNMRPPNAADILAIRGVLDAPRRDEGETGRLKAALEADLEPLLADFQSMRAGEGAALAKILATVLGEIEDLHQLATKAAEARGAGAGDLLRSQIEKVLNTTDAVGEDRLAQELALLAVKADVSEELDRLASHIGAARDLLAAAGPKGRKLEFLVQEFNREANTLCSKSGSTELTRIGLDLKAAIDRLREQVLNVE
ncbi:MAG: YicC/YloC family endoribonuclease [Pseudomonadota bacterium]